jgi:hypothetical protein
VHPDPRQRAKQATEQLTDRAEMEIKALSRLTKAKCPYTPKLLSWSRVKQDTSMWIPGGWLVFILMKKLPGASPFNFWAPDAGRPAMTRAQRDEVREAFKKALS